MPLKDQIFHILVSLKIRQKEVFLPEAFGNKTCIGL